MILPSIKEILGFNASESDSEVLLKWKHYPEEIPPEILKWECKVFGHICPVIFSLEFVSELG